MVRTNGRSTIPMRKSATSSSHLPPGIPEGTDPAMIVDDGFNPPYVASGRPYVAPARPAAPKAAPKGPAPTGLTQAEHQQKTQGPGKVGRGFNMGLDVGYAVIWSVVALLGIAALFTPARLWGLPVIAFGGYFAVKNIIILVRLRGRE
jgi:hypothetical protein